MRIFTFVFTRDTGLKISWGILVWFWYQNNAGPVDWVWKSSLFYFSFFNFGRVWKGLVLILLRMFGWIHQWSHLILNFVCRGVSDDQILSLLVISLFRFSVFHNWLDRLSLGIYLFLLDHLICWHMIIHIGLLWHFVFLWYQL